MKPAYRIATLFVAAFFGSGRTQPVTEKEAVVALPEFFVAGERVGALELAVPRGDLRPPEPNLGSELLAIPGVFGQSRAADAMEPSIRGLSLDRVATTINGLPLVNASPERTNSPVVILGPAAVTDITVMKALPSVTLGPVTSGGRIALGTEDQAAEAAAAPRFRGFVSTTYNGARDGFASRSRIASRLGAWGADVTFFHNDLGDYRSPNGRHVAARLDESGASAALACRTVSHQARVEFLQRRLRRQETLSLPLDGKNTDSDVITVNESWQLRSGVLEKLEWRAGFSYTDPYITSEDRKVPTLTFARATARSAAGGLTSIWRSGEQGTIAAGGDYSRQTRRAVRTTVTGSDYIWPGVTYTDAGVFAEWNRPLPLHWALRLGARADDVRSDAADADMPALGRPIRQQFAAYNGPAAAQTKRHDAAGAVNALLRWHNAGRLTAFVGAGFSVQPAQVMERYRALLNALGGDGHGGNAVELGNPTLSAERKWALETGGTSKHDWADFEATLYYYRIDDFILRTRLGTTLPPLANMVIFGYRNVDADFFGGEVGVTCKPAKEWTLPLTFAVAEARNRARHAGIAEIPPWEAASSIRYQAQHAGLFAELGARIAGAKNNPTPFENPIFAATGGFAVWHLRGGVPLGKRLRLQAGAENIFNKNYAEYLTPPVAPFKPASGDLLPGERVPAPQRSCWVSVTWAF